MQNVLCQFQFGLFNLPRWQKRLIMVSADILLIPLALWVSFVLRLSDWTPALGNHAILLFIIAPLISIPIFTRLGLYRAVIRFIGSQVLEAIFKGAVISATALVLFTVFTGLDGIPRSVFLIYCGTLILFIGGSRHLVRQFFRLTQDRSHRTNVAIYGAGASGVQLAQALLNSPEYRPMFFLDDNRTLHNSAMHGLKVYAPDALTELLKNYPIEQLLLALPSVEQQRRREILQHLEPLPVHVKTIPGLSDLVSGTSVAELREIDIDDLLGREPVTPDTQLLKNCIVHKNVMVTGAGGSIGSELCRQIIQHNPQKLILFEISEFALYTIERELLGLCEHDGLEVELITAMGSVRNQSRIQALLSEHKVHTLYHAAAYKHVPLVEHNPIEGLQNNVLGTYHAALAAQHSGVERFILISTDKAVRPTNVMGASKRLAELALQALAKESDITVFSMVRFGNVLGSSGSVVPLFRKQIHAGGPVTVTHPDIIRYFMTIPEAAQLVIQAGAMAKGGEVFLLDMGEPVKIFDLARRMIHLSGLQEKNTNQPNGDIAITFTGLRPGEKLYEELLIDADSVRTAHPRIFHAHEKSININAFQTMLNNLQDACEKTDINTLYRLLQEYVSGYQIPEHMLPDKVVALPIANRLSA